MKTKIIEIINEIRDRAIIDHEKAKRVAGHSAYGTGVEWGVITACDELLKEINENKA